MRRWKRRALKGLGVMTAGALVFVGWAWFESNRLLTTPFSLTLQDVATPPPLTDDEIAAYRKELEAARAEVPDAPVVADVLDGVDLTKVAEKRSVERGKYLAEVRHGCADCHGDDFGGKVVADAMPVIHMVAPNITPGGVTADFANTDWLRILRHGVTHSGTASLMPAIDSTWLSDREIGDLITFLRSVPPVDRTMPPAALGPLGRIFTAIGQMPLDAWRIDHDAPRAALPPEARPDAVFGKHIAQTCVGCHGATFTGGPIPGGPPDWPPASNLTPHESGMEYWSEADFVKAISIGVSPGGRKLHPAMPYRMLSKLKPVEKAALWAYLRTLPPLPTGSR